MLTMLEEIAIQKNKIPALTEFGYAQVPDSTWWTNVLYKALGNHQISYALAWRSAGFKPSAKPNIICLSKARYLKKIL
jgi:hypothetical protein